MDYGRVCTLTPSLRFTAAPLTPAQKREGEKVIRFVRRFSLAPLALFEGLVRRLNSRPACLCARLGGFALAHHSRHIFLHPAG